MNLTTSAVRSAIASLKSGDLVKLLLLAFLFTLASCGTPKMVTGHIMPGRISAVTIGMTKEQVLHAVGEPASMAADTTSETLIYVEERPWWQWMDIKVKLVDGKVIEFGPAR